MRMTPSSGRIEPLSRYLLDFVINLVQIYAIAFFHIFALFVNPSLLCFIVLSSNFPTQSNVVSTLHYPSFSHQLQYFFGLTASLALMLFAATSLSFRIDLCHHICLETTPNGVFFSLFYNRSSIAITTRL